MPRKSIIRSSDTKLHALSVTNSAVLSTIMKKLLILCADTCGPPPNFLHESDNFCESDQRAEFDKARIHHYSIPSDCDSCGVPATLGDSYFSTLARDLDDESQNFPRKSVTSSPVPISVSSEASRVRVRTRSYAVNLNLRCSFLGYHRGKLCFAKHH